MSLKSSIMLHNIFNNKKFFICRYHMTLRTAPSPSYREPFIHDYNNYASCKRKIKNQTLLKISSYWSLTIYTSALVVFLFHITKQHSRREKHPVLNWDYANLLLASGTILVSSIMWTCLHVWWLVRRNPPKGFHTNVWFNLRLEWILIETDRIFQPWLYFRITMNGWYLELIPRLDYVITLFHVSDDVSLSLTYNTIIYSTSLFSHY